MGILSCAGFETRGVPGPQRLRRSSAGSGRDVIPDLYVATWAATGAAAPVCVLPASRGETGGRGSGAVFRIARQGLDPGRSAQDRDLPGARIRAVGAMPQTNGGRAIRRWGKAGLRGGSQALCWRGATPMRAELPRLSGTYPKVRPDRRVRYARHLLADAPGWSGDRTPLTARHALFPGSPVPRSGRRASGGAWGPQPRGECGAARSCPTSSRTPLRPPPVVRGATAARERAREALGFAASGARSAPCVVPLCHQKTRELHNSHAKRGARLADIAKVLEKAPAPTFSSCGWREN